MSSKKNNKIAIALLLLSLFYSSKIVSQTLQDGCKVANFGVDADLHANSSDFGNAQANSNASDDWFKEDLISPGPGIGIIDTTGGSALRDQLQSGQNVAFLSKMAVPNNSIITGKRMQDATYARDYYGGTGTIDITSFNTASKNGEDPADWDTGDHNVLPKNDLIDCYAHLRRDGITADDDLWLFLGFSRVANTGSSYFDAEIFAGNIEYNSTTEQFTSPGLEEGHNAWEFDNSGNITKIGDLIVSVVLNTSATPEYEIRIWVKKSDYVSKTPATFKFGPELDGASNGSKYGYASVLPKISPVIGAITNFGCALVNSGPIPAPPWGSTDSNGDFTDIIEENQFSEFGLNLSKFGIDPSLIEGIDACISPFNNVLFKARASASFNAQLKDFNGPYEFGDINYIPSYIVGEPLNCLSNQATLHADSLQEGAFYSWETPDGNILTDPDQFEIIVDQPGTYILFAAAIDGCNGIRDTFLVEMDTIPPLAYIDHNPIYGCNFVTVDLSAGEPGMQYSWTGPNGFSSNLQDITVSEPGMYYLAVTRPSNGCIAYDSINVIQYPCQGDLTSNVPTTTIIDTIPPSFNLPPDITLECTEIANVSLTGEATNEDDNCDPDIGEAEYTDVIIPAHGCEGATLILRTWSLTDDCGNTTSLVQEILLEDIRPPAFTVPPAITISCDQIPDPGTTGNISNAIDNCDTNLEAPVYQDVVQNNEPCIGASIITRTWTLTDDCGNDSIQIQIINLEDKTPPVFTVPENITLECDTDINDLTITGNVIDESDICDSSIGEATYSDVVSPLSFCLGARNIRRTWTLTDACGNTNTQIQNINLLDRTPPVFTTPENITLSCDDDPNDLVLTGNAINVSDNCDSNIGTPSHSDTYVYDTPCDGSIQITRSWFLEDDCGNSTSGVQILTLRDTTPPLFIVPTDLTLQCDSDISDTTLTGSPTGISDNCDSNIGIPTYSDFILPNPNCNGESAIERTWSLTDDCGNESRFVQSITLIDTIAPTFTLPEDLTLECDQDPTDPNLTGVVWNESDNCDNSIGQATYTDIRTDDPDCFGAAIIERIWSLTDDCGNIAVDTQLITIEDSTPPQIQGIPNEINFSCDSVVNPPVLGIEITATDNCSTPSIISLTFNQDTLFGDCTNEYTLIRTWTATDDCGNSLEISRAIAIEDNGIPVIFSLPPDISANCDAVPDTASIIVTDNCDNQPEVVFSEQIIPGNCPNNYSILRTWTWSDDCGNNNSHTQEIIIVDDQAPIFTIPDNITIECDQDPNDLNLTGIAFGESDNCDNNLGPINYTDSISLSGTCSQAYHILRTWILVDNCGNTTSNVQEITVEDPTPPSFTTPDDLTVFLDLDCNLQIDTTFTGSVSNESDNCSININAVYSDQLNSLNGCNGTGTFLRIWSLTDDCGNVAIDTQFIAVEDTLAPIFNTPLDITLFLDGNCWVDTTTSTTGTLSNVQENCSNATVVYNDDLTFLNDCNGTGYIIRHWMVSDDCGNMSLDSQRISILDTLSPTFISPQDLTLYLDSNCWVDTTLSQTGNPSTLQDNCSTNLNAIYTDDLTLLSECNGTGVFRRIWSLSDDCGNTSVDTQIIAILDTISPTFITPANMTLFLGLNCELDSSTIVTGQISNVNDNCNSNLVALYNDDLSGLNECSGTGTFSRTWTVSDSCGNTTTGIQIITVRDTINPIFTIPSDTTLYLDFNCQIDTSTSSIGSPQGIDDNCSSILQSVYNDQISGLNGCNGTGTFLRIWSLTDDCGNVAIDTQFIAVEDTLAPIFNTPVDITLFLNQNCTIDTSINNTGSISPIDNCSGSVLTSHIDDISELNSCSGTGTLKRIWTAIDNCGNAAIDTQWINIADTLAPTFVTPADLTIFSDLNCFADTTANFTGTISNINGICANSEPQYWDDFSLFSGCNSTGTFKRIWTLSDECGNTTIDSQFITIMDTLAPTFIPPADLTLFLDSLCSIDTTSANTGIISTIGDNCTGILDTLYIDDLSGLTGCNGTGTFSRIWTLSDECGNSTIDTQWISIRDTLSPFFIIPPDTTLYLDLNCFVDTTSQSTGITSTNSNPCNDNLQITYTDDLSGLNDCSGTGTILRNWSIINPCGNTGTGQQEIIIIDTLAPTFSAPADITVYLETDCTIDTTTNNTGMVIGAIDNCNNLADIVYQDHFDETISACARTGTFNRIWTLSDHCGNINIDTQSITIQDTLSPTFVLPPDVSLTCGDDKDDLNLTGIVSAEQDYCHDLSGQAIYRDTTHSLSSDCAATFIINRIWSLTDSCGNTMEATQRIFFMDTIAPIISGVPQDTVINCGVIPPVATPTASDLCDTTVQISFNEDFIPGPCNGTFTIVREWTAIDFCNNESISRQLIEMVDTIAPVLLTLPSDITVDCDSIPSPPLLDIADDCDPDFNVLVNDNSLPGACINSYTIDRTWTMTDHCGNSSTYTQKITVLNCDPNTGLGLGPDTTICAGENVSFQVTLIQGYINPVFQWQFSSDGQTWGDISDATETEYFITNALTNQSGWYRAIVANDSIQQSDTICNIKTDQVFLQVNPVPPPTNLSYTICEGDSILWNNSVYYLAGIYSDTFPSIFLCDSIVNVELIVLPTAREDQIIPLCTGELYNGLSITNDTTIIDSLIGSNGCDSLISTHLNILPNQLTHDTISICRGQTYNGIIYQNDTTFVNLFNTTQGCDSTVFTFLNILDRFLDSLEVNICLGESFRGEFYITDTIITDSLQSTFGCDSIIQTYLYINLPQRDTQNVQLCLNELFNNVSYSTDTILRDTFQTSAGCDSIHQININIFPLYLDTTSIDICAGGTFQGITFQMDSTWTILYTSVNGCDSTQAYEVNVLPLLETNVALEICLGDSIFAAGAFQTTSGTYVDQYLTSNGCDSIVNTILTVNPEISNQLDFNICLGDSVLVNGVFYYSSISFTDSLSTQFGCDSLVQVDIVVTDQINTQESVDLCFGESFDSIQYTNNNILLDTMISSAGCDSIHQININIFPLYFDTTSIHICAGGTFQGITFQIDSTWNILYTSVNGCDSTQVFEVNVLPLLETDIALEICLGDSIFAAGAFQTTSGAYVDQYLTSNGCDSIVNTILTVNPEIINQLDFNICSGDSVLVNGIFYYSTISFTDSLSTQLGCDSLVHVDIIVTDQINTQETIDLCFGESFDSIQYTNNTILLDTTISSAGCDSIHQININIFPLYFDTTSIDICAGGTFQGITFQMDSTWNILYTSVNGCDSTQVFEVNVLPLLETNVALEICLGDSIFAAGAFQTTSGTYVDQYLTSNGCDSIVNTILTVNPEIINQLDFNICSGDSVLVNGIYYYSTISFTDSLSTQLGCDSLVQVDIVVTDQINTQESVDLCFGDVLDGIQYANDTILLDTTVNAFGCDSIHQIDINIFPLYLDTTTIDICAGGTFQGITFQMDSTWTTIYSSINGCDSTQVYEVNVLPLFETNIPLEICLGDSIFAAGAFQTTSGTYVDQYTTSNGCDSVINTILTVHSPTINQSSYSICPGDSVLVNGIFYDAAISFTDTFSTQLGCDSLVQVEIIVTNQINTQESVDLCFGEFFEGLQYSNDTILLDTTTNTSGCDSIHQINISVFPIYLDTTSVVLCAGETFQGTTFLMDSTWTAIYTSVNGCDSIQFFEVNVLPVFETNIPLEICLGDSIFAAGAFQTTSGTYVDQYTATNGCDSTVNTILTVHYPLFIHMTYGICQGDSILINGLYYSTPISFTDTFSTQLGCDSLVHSQIIVTNQINTQQSVDLCFGELFEGILYPNDTILLDTSISIFGCDSTHQIDINVFPIHLDTTSVELCAGDLFQGITFHIDSTWSTIYSSVDGCDSTQVFEVQVLPLFETNISLEICLGDSIFAAGAFQTTSGTYVDQHTSISGCDSIVNTILTVHPPVLTPLIYSICPGDSVMVNGIFYSTANSFTDTFSSQLGCDSLVNFKISLLSIQETYLSEVICEGDSVLINGNYEKEAGTYNQTLQGSNSCDSIIHIKLIVEQPVALVAQDHEICLGEEVQLNVEGSTNIIWSPSYGLSCITCPDPIASPEITTVYTVSAPSCDGTTATTLVLVTVHQTPIIEVDADIEVVLGDSLYLSAEVTNSYGAMLSWYNAEGDTLCNNCEELWTLASSYKYQVIAVSSEGCIAKDEVNIRIKTSCTEGTLDAPNFITPNGDGHNDFFEVKYNNYQRLGLLRIYNRWGELVFETTNVENDKWDGTFRGQTLNPDVYVYYLEAYCLSGDLFIHKGNITIIK